MHAPKEKISALIITYNEINHIAKCVESLMFADEILVVDSYSTDGTYEFLKAHPAVRVIQHPFSNFTLQKSYTLSKASHDWVLFVDADEVIPPALREEILHTVNSGTDRVAFWVYRRFMFDNEPLRFSGWQTDKNYRLFRRSKAQFSQHKLVHETLRVKGRSGILKERLIHYCYKNYQDYKGKMLLYGRLKAREAYLKNVRFTYAKLLLKPFWKFFYNYVCRLGFLDGQKGITICYLGALEDVERYRALRQAEREGRAFHTIEKAGRKVIPARSIPS